MKTEEILTVLLKEDTKIINVLKYKPNTQKMKTEEILTILLKQEHTNHQCPKISNQTQRK